MVLVPLWLIVKRSFLTWLKPQLPLSGSSQAVLSLPEARLAPAPGSLSPNMYFRGLEHVCFGVRLGLIGAQRETTPGGGGRWREKKKRQQWWTYPWRQTGRLSLSRNIWLQSNFGLIGLRNAKTLWPKIGNYLMSLFNWCFWYGVHDQDFFSNTTH